MRGFLASGVVVTCACCLDGYLPAEKRFAHLDDRSRRDQRFQLDLGAVGQHDGADQRRGALRQPVGVEPAQRITGRDVLAGRDQQLEPLATQIDGIEPDVQQPFVVAIVSQRDRMGGPGALDDLAVAGGVQRFPQRVDRDTRPHDAFAKDRVGHFRQRDHDPAHRGTEKP